MSDILLGRIVKAFGIRGELKFHPADDFWAEALASKRLVMRTVVKGREESTAFEPMVLRPHGNSYVVGIAGVEDRNAAEALVGAEVFVSEDGLDVPLPDTLLPYQVVGMTVKDESLAVLGEVTRVVYSTAHDIYEVEGPQGNFMVPAVPEFIVDVDTDERTIVVRPLPGLIGD